MELKNKEYNLVATEYDGIEYDSINFTQNDTRNCVLNLTIPYEVDEMVIIVTKPSGIEITDRFPKADDTDKNFRIELPSYLIDEVGTYKATLQAYGCDYDRRTVGTFKYKAAKEIIPSESDVQDKVPLLTKAISDVNDLYDKVVDIDHGEGGRILAEEQRVIDENIRKENEVVREEKKEELLIELEKIKLHNTKSILEFGGIGDDLFDNTNAFVNAIEYFKIRGGGTLHIPKGVFQTSPFSTCDNLTIKGDGLDSVIKVKNGNGDFYSLMSLKDKSNITVSNVTFDVNRLLNGGKVYTNGISGTQAQILIYLRNSKNINISSCKFISCGVWAITCESTQDNPINRDISICNNIFYWSEGESDPQPNLGSSSKKYDNTTVFMEATNYVISNNTFICEDGKGETAIEGHTGYGVISENYIDNYNNGVLIVANHWSESSDGYLGKRNVDTECKSNTIKNVNTGIRLWQVSTRDLDNVTILNNKINLNPKKNKSVACMGISNLITTQTFTTKIKNIIVDGNMIEYQYDDTVYSDSDNVLNFSGIAFGFRTPIENLTITNNTINNSPATGIALVNYDSIISKNISVSNNTIINCGSNPNLSTQDYNPKCAIRTNSNFKNVVIGENYIIDDSFLIKLTKVYSLSSDVQYSSPLINVYDTTFIKENTKYTFSPKMRFDSQVGTITTVANDCYYIRKGNYVKLHLDITLKDKNITTGYGAYIKLPFNFSNECYSLISYYSNITTSSTCLFVKSIKDTNILNIFGNKTDTAIGSFTSDSVKNDSRLVFDIEYDINFNNTVFGSIIKDL